MKVLFLFWHGLGDNILATPAIKAYKEQHPDHYIGWAMLRRFKSAQLWNPYIDEYHWVSDAWNDFRSYEEGCKQVIIEAKQIERTDRRYDKLIVIDHKSSSKHKIHRNADEMGVTVTAPKTEFYFQYPICNHPVKDFNFFHGKTGVETKDISMSDINNIHGIYGLFMPIVDANIDKPLWYYAEYLKNADQIFVADSVYFHIACALGRKPNVAYFARGKPVFDVVKPLHMDVSSSVIYEL